MDDQPIRGNKNKFGLVDKTLIISVFITPVSGFRLVYAAQIINPATNIKACIYSVTLHLRRC